MFSSTGFHAFLWLVQFSLEYLCTLSACTHKHRQTSILVNKRILYECLSDSPILYQLYSICVSHADLIYLHNFPRDLFFFFFFYYRSMHFSIIVVTNTNNLTHLNALFTIKHTFQLLRRSYIVSFDLRHRVMNRCCDDQEKCEIIYLGYNLILLLFCTLNFIWRMTICVELLFGKIFFDSFWAVKIRIYITLIFFIISMSKIIIRDLLL